jgi:hypothetical protein
LSAVVFFRSVPNMKYEYPFCHKLWVQLALVYPKEWGFSIVYLSIWFNNITLLIILYKVINVICVCQCRDVILTHFLQLFVVKVQCIYDKQNHTELATLTHLIGNTDRICQATIYLYPRACVTIKSSDKAIFLSGIEPTKSV